ncbi:rhodanese-like domain-containing protein [Vibrio hepatarius]|uniref:rhodanese-like domain-containing protein n=1 Tax=Vibrio hepatarius TaxID=171383 RepID=UPI001C0824E1|nr:rhodanese-like domain-containing protein [Vibrio hepatarius]MBU2897049.1 rhodanese-like domain-containing protein [Vibrio hepatarius]
MTLFSRTLAVIFFTFPLTILAEGKAPDSIPGTTKITAEGLIDLVDEMDDLVIIDSRIEKDRTDGFIEGAVALPDVDTAPATLVQHIPSKATLVAFYCNGPKCGRSVKASKIALEAGYTNVYWFRGGWEEWRQKGFPASM